MAFRKSTHQSVGEAVLANQIDMGSLFARRGAHLRSPNYRCENVLHLVSNICNPEMFGVLVPVFQEGVHQTDDQGHVLGGNHQEHTGTGEQIIRQNTTSTK